VHVFHLTAAARRTLETNSTMANRNGPVPAQAEVG
jgi:hypothetical protein